MSDTKHVECPHCGHDDITRVPGHEHVGPIDLCTNCSEAWPTKPGTITKAQVRTREMPKRPAMET